jgi:hypothetical protein
MKQIAEQYVHYTTFTLHRKKNFKQCILSLLYTLRITPEETQKMRNYRDREGGGQVERPHCLLAYVLFLCLKHMIVILIPKIELNT